jgi:hypothetical protein
MLYEVGADAGRTGGVNSTLWWSSAVGLPGAATYFPTTVRLLSTSMGRASILSTT